MKKLATIFFILFLVYSNYGQTQRIYGGEEIEISEAPYQVAITYFRDGSQQLCGGVIIDCNWILTAAHCMEGLTESSVTVRAGTNEWDDLNGGQEVGVAEIIMHPFYVPANLIGGGMADPAENDIALLRLDTALEPFGDKIKTVLVANDKRVSPTDMAPGNMVYISGWGTSEDSPTSAEDKLRAAWVPIISHSDANELLDHPENTCVPSNGVDETMYFPVFEDGSAAGKGDSGGPAIIEKNGKTYLVGLTSWGFCSANEQLVLPSIYVNLLNYQDFISDNLHSSCCDEYVQYHLKTSEGEEQNTFCLGEDVFIGIDELYDNDKYHLDLWKVQANGELKWISGEGWQNGSPENINIVDVFQSNIDNPVTFESGIEYVVKLAIDHPVCGWVEQLEHFTFINEEAILSYHYETSEGEEQTEFCIGEDVYIDASESLNTGSYFMSLWVKTESGDYNWIIGSDWVNGDLSDPINITTEFEALTGNPDLFQSGKTYAVKFSIIDDICGQGQLWLQKDFKYRESTIAFNYENAGGTEQIEFCIGEDVYLDGAESYDVDSYFMSLWVQTASGGYNWIIGSDWMPGDLNTPVNITTLFEGLTGNPNLFQPDKTYAVKLSIIDPHCGQVWLQQDFKINDCCVPAAPENLQFSNNTLSWDPVPEAVRYVVETAPWPWAADCTCSYPISIIPVPTTATSVTFSIGPNRCSEVQVVAICEDGTQSAPSTPLCLRFGMAPDPIGITQLTISPNPNKGTMHVRITSNLNYNSITIKLFDLNGRIIEHWRNLTMSEKETLVHTINMEDQLKRGVYFLQVVSGNNTLVKQVIID